MSDNKRPAAVFTLRDKASEKGSRMDVLIDCAGAPFGGARRYLDELTGWLAHNPAAPIRLVGVGRRVGARHLILREIQAFREGGRRVVALNNVGCVATRAERWLLLANALQFPLPGEDMHISAALARRLAAKAAVVRFTARRADVVVVPASSMAERVLHHIPSLSRHLVITPHPVSPRPTTPVSPGLVVCPVMFEPYKRMGHHLAILAKAVEQLRQTHGRRLDVRVTATREEFEEVRLRSDGPFTPVGRLPTDEVAKLLSRAEVIYFPPTLEAFGYPLAEARVNGQPVVAPNSTHTREVAGPALVPYDEESVDAVAAALSRAIEGDPPQPDPAPFCPDSYFRRWLA